MTLKLSCKKAITEKKVKDTETFTTYTKRIFFYAGCEGQCAILFKET